MTIELPADIEARLKGEAQRYGIAADEYAKEILLHHFGPVSGLPKAESIHEMFARWAAEDHTDDPEEITRRNEEVEDFKRQMNQNRLDMEGPNARKLYP